MVTGAMARNRWLALAVLSATFLAGGAIGVAVARVVTEKQAEQPTRPPDGRRDQRNNGPSIFDQMGLTTAQQAAMDSIMEKRRRDLDAFWKLHNPEVRAIIDSARVEIDRLLTPAQRKQFEDFRARRNRDHADRDGGQRPPPPPANDSGGKPLSLNGPKYLG